MYRELDTVGWLENHVYEGVVPLLTDISRSPHQMAVVTSKATVFAERIVAHFGLRGFFDRVVGATLGGSLRHKQHLIAALLRDTGTSGVDAVMIGDRAHDVVGARANGVRAIGARWGYAEPGELEAAGAHVVATRPTDLLALIDP